MKKILSIRGTEVNDKMYLLEVSKEFIEIATPEIVKKEVINYFEENYELKGETRIVNIDFKSDIKSIFVTLSEKVELKNKNKYKLRENDVIRITDLNILWIYSDPEKDLVIIRLLNPRDKFWNTMFLKILIRSMFVTKGLILKYEFKKRNFEIFLSRSEFKSLNRVELISLIIYSEKNAENLDLNVTSAKFKDIKDKLMNDPNSDDDWKFN